MNILNFVWREHLRAIIWTAVLSITPLFEGRFAVLAGREWGLPMAVSLVMTILVSTLPMLIIMPLSGPIRRCLKKSPLAGFVEPRILRGAEKIGARGLLGLFLFTALPLPGTGVWTGALISSMLGYSRARAMAVIFLGNICACLIMSVVYFFVRTAL